MCFCGSLNDYEVCCGKYHNGQAYPQSAELLMKSRFSAFATSNLDYLLKTSSKSLAETLTKQALKETCDHFNFVRLDVICAVEEINTVEFKAYLLANDVVSILHENSQFIVEQGMLKYDSGELFETKDKNVKRNDNCPCGSGKKYKKCHLL